MKLLQKIVLSLLIFSSCGISAQTLPATAQVTPMPKRYIEVIGSSEMDLQPNIIVLSIRLKEYEENKNKVPLEKIESSFLASVAKSNIAKDKIQISDLSLTAVQRGRKDRDVFSEKSYEITFSKTEDVLKLLENSKDVKMDNLEIQKLSHTEIQKFRLEVKVDALKAAEMKAAALVKAVGSKLGQVLLIDEQRESAWPQPNMMSNTLYANSMKTYDADQMLVKSIKLRYEVVARFEID